MHIKNIIFDLGAVILNIDYNGPAKRIEKYGIKNFNQLYSKAKQDKLFDDFEKGYICPNTFRNSFRNYINIPLSNKEIDTIWNAVILDFPEKRIQLLLNLKKRYTTFLLSNTNIIHYNFYTQILHNTYNEMTWSNLLHKSYFSFEMGKRKPDVDIFQKVIRENMLKPSETLFIDDLKENILSAQSCGLQTIWLNENTELTDLFDYDKLIVPN